MGGPGIASSAIRFILHTPLGLYGFSNLGYYYLVRDHVELQDDVYNPIILQAETLAGVGGVILWVWNFVMWLPTAFAVGWPLLIIGLVDAGFALTLCFAVAYQARFTPHSKVECGYVADLPPPGTNVSFFRAAGTINDTGDASSPGDFCEGLVDMWALGIAMIIFLGFSSICNVLGGIVTIADSPKVSGKEVLTVLLFIPLLPFMALYFLFKLLYLILVALLNLSTPRPVQQRFLYARRYTRKLYQRLGLPVLRLPTRQNWKPWVPRTPPAARASAGPALSPRHELTLSEKMRADRLAENLPFDILALLARQLHYIDLRNLSLASRSVREAVFPARDGDRRELLRVYTCTDGSKASCGGCGIQTCADCSHARGFSDTPTAFHLAKCRLTCSACFFATLVKSTSGARISGGCGCITRASGSGTRDQRVCRECYRLGNEELKQRCEARAAAEARHLMLQPLACSRCAAPLPPKGVRWWVCERCGRECRSGVHPGWAEKRAVKMEV